MIKKIKAWCFFGFLLLLNGCKSTIDYDPELFKPKEENCWPCKMYMQAFYAIQKTLAVSLPIMAENCLAIMAVLGIKDKKWNASNNLEICNYPDVKKDLREIMIVLFKAMIVAILLSVKTGTGPDKVYIDFSSSDSYKSSSKFQAIQIEDIGGKDTTGKVMLYDVAGKMFIQPIANIFLGISELALASPSSVGISMSNYSSSTKTMSSAFSDFFNKALEKLKGKINEKTNGAFSGDISEISKAINKYYAGDKIAEDDMFGELPMKIQTMIWMLYDSLWSGMGLAFQLFQLGSIAAFLSGILIFAALFNMMIILPISFVEAILFMGLTVILLPFYLYYWIFPNLSKGMLKKLFHQIFAAFFDILFYCIYVAFLVSVLRVYLKANKEVSYLFSSDFQSQEAGLREEATNMGTSFLIMTVLIWTILKLFDHVHEYSGYFFDGAGDKSNIVQFVNRAKAVAWAAVKTVYHAATGNYASAAGDLKELGDQTQGLMRDTMGEQMDHGETRQKLQSKNKYSDYEGKDKE